jgi:DNA-binding transcriptional MerR regulator
MELIDIKSPQNQPTKPTTKIPRDLIPKIYDYYFNKHKNTLYIFEKLKKKGITLKQVKATVEHLSTMNPMNRLQFIQTLKNKSKAMTTTKKELTERRKPIFTPTIELYLGRNCPLCNYYEAEIITAMNRLKKKYKHTDFKINWTWEDWIPPPNSQLPVNDLEVEQRWEEVINDLKIRSLGIMHIPAFLLYGFKDIPSQFRDHTQFVITELEKTISFIIENKLPDDLPLPAELRPQKTNLGVEVVSTRVTTHGINPRWD